MSNQRSIIDYLTQKRLPDERRLIALAATVGGVSDRDRKAACQRIHEYEAELRAKTEAELKALCEQVKEKERQEAEERQQEELQRLFKGPGTKADFEHWSKAAYWTLDESVALSLGKKPG